MRVSLDTFKSWPTDFYLEGWKFMIIDKIMRERMTKEKMDEKHGSINEKYHFP